MNPLTLLALLQTTYCERSGPGPLAEPLNALSNLAFLAAAALAAGRVGASQRRDLGIRLLPWLLAAVGTASALYHTFRSPATFFVDLLLLAGFMAFSIFLALHRVMARPSLAWSAGAGLLLLQLLTLLLVPNDFLNGSAPHLATLLFVALLWVAAVEVDRVLSRQVVPLLAFYAAAITFRTVDLAFCPWAPIGTHFLWHIAGAAAAYFVIRLVCAVDAAQARQPGLAG